MPELPEVETVRRQLEASVLKRPIADVEVRDASILRNASEEFQEKLIGTRICEIRRIGKLLEFHLENGFIMLAHLKMTGQFLYQKSGEIQAGIYPLLYASTSGGKKAAGSFRKDQAKKGLLIKHTHLLITFEDTSVLAFRDVRKFGYLHIIGKDQLKNIHESYGIDPLQEDFTREAFHETFSGRQKSLKAILMDQALIAGIGNIYADEICHRTRIHPLTSAAKLQKKQVDELYYACSEIIQHAVKHKGTTFRDFAGADGEPGGYAFELRAYGREGEKCLQCDNGIIQKTTYLGRGTHFCKDCQIQ